MEPDPTNPDWLEWYLRNTAGTVILSAKPLLHNGRKP